MRSGIEQTVSEVKKVEAAVKMQEEALGYTKKVFEDITSSVIAIVKQAIGKC